MAESLKLRTLFCLKASIDSRAQAKKSKHYGSRALPRKSPTRMSTPATPGPTRTVLGPMQVCLPQYASPSPREAQQRCMLRAALSFPSCAMSRPCSASRLMTNLLGNATMHRHCCEIYCSWLQLLRLHKVARPCLWPLQSPSDFLRKRCLRIHSAARWVTAQHFRTSGRTPSSRHCK